MFSWEAAVPPHASEKCIGRKMLFTLSDQQGSFASVEPFYPIYRYEREHTAPTVYLSRHQRYLSVACVGWRNSTHKIVRSRNLRRNGKCFFIGKAPAARNNASGDEGREQALRSEGTNASSAGTCALLLIRSGGGRGFGPWVVTHRKNRQTGDVPRQNLLN